MSLADLGINGKDKIIVTTHIACTIMIMIMSIRGRIQMQRTSSLTIYKTKAIF